MNFDIDSASLEHLGLPPLAQVAFILIGVAFGSVLILDLLKLLFVAIWPNIRKARFWRFGIRLVAILLGAGIGYMLLPALPVWGVLLGAISGASNAAIRSKFKIAVKKKLEQGEEGVTR